MNFERHKRRFIKNKKNRHNNVMVDFEIFFTAKNDLICVLKCVLNEIESEK